LFFPSSQASNLLIEWLALMSLLGFAAMGIDKALAVGGFSRIRERSLWFAALLGGFPGVFVGGYVFHHKTSKPQFWWPVAISVVLWVAGWQLFLRLV